MSDDVRHYRFRRRSRLKGRRAYQYVFDAAVRKKVGPICLYARPNDLSHPRLGLSVSRRVGGAVSRNRIKRRVREAFRLTQHDWPGAYDVIVVVYPHEPATLADYQRLLHTALRSVHQRWRRIEDKGVE